MSTIVGGHYGDDVARRYSVNANQIVTQLPTRPAQQYPLAVSLFPAYGYCITLIHAGHSISTSVLIGARNELAFPSQRRALPFEVLFRHPSAGQGAWIGADDNRSLPL